MPPANFQVETVPNVVTYEHPLHERVRILLRLEHLFRHLSHYLRGESAADSRVVVATLLEVLDIFSRGDVKTELIKEMERAGNNLQPLLENPEVDHGRLGTVLRALERLHTNLHGLSGQLGQALREDDLLAGVRQRTSIPGGTCDFDLPGFHFWLERPREARWADIERWHGSLDAVRQPVELLLKLIRNSAEPRPRTATAGGYQQSLDTAIPYQMLRIALPDDAPYYPEVSGGRHRFSIRLVQPREGRPVQVEEDVEFSLSCCSL